MHFSIPETVDLKDEKHNSSFVAYNVHVNGSFHCTVRYKQLYSFHEQLKKAFGHNSLPFFPPKRLLPLTQPQIEERRSYLEKYIQILSQDQKIVNSEFFNAFLLNAQQESQHAKAEQINLDVYVMNWQTVNVQVTSTSNSAAILEAVAKSLNLADQYIPYFCLFLVIREGTNDKNYILVKKLQNFEAPYLSLLTANSNCNSYCIVMRKCYWDSSFDDEIIDNEVALNLLFGQTISDIESGWITATKEVRKQLNTLQAKGSKREFVGLARTLKYYGYLQFEPCFSNYPQVNSRVTILAGGKELIIKAADQTKEFCFRVTRIRCWRLTASPLETNGSSSSERSKFTRFELSFEYLLSKDVLKWITINSSQAILISMCLRGMVEELLMKKKGLKLSNDWNEDVDLLNRRGSWSYMKRDGSSHQISIPRSVSTDTFMNGKGHSKGRKNQLKNENSTKNRSLVENDAFDGIGDDDL